MPSKHKKRPAAPVAGAGALGDPRSFRASGPDLGGGARGGGPPIQEGDDRAGVGRRADPPSGLSAGWDQAGGHDAIIGMGRAARRS